MVFLHADMCFFYGEEGSIRSKSSETRFWQ